VRAQQSGALICDHVMNQRIFQWTCAFTYRPVRLTERMLGHKLTARLHRDPSIVMTSGSTAVLLFVVFVHCLTKYSAFQIDLSFTNIRTFYRLIPQATHSQTV